MSYKSHPSERHELLVESALAYPSAFGNWTVALPLSPNEIFAKPSDRGIANTASFVLITPPERGSFVSVWAWINHRDPAEALKRGYSEAFGGVSGSKSLFFRFVNSEKQS